MTAVAKERRVQAVKLADALNAIEGVPVSDYARTLSSCWETTFVEIHAVSWDDFTREEFVSELVKWFPLSGRCILSGKGIPAQL